MIFQKIGTKDEWGSDFMCTTCHTLKQVEQNATNKQSGTIFQVSFSDGVFCFVLHFKTLLLIGFEISTAN